MEIPAFLKWAGGKRRLIPQIDPHLPKTIENYFEPFLGAGAMFFYIRQKYSLQKYILSDINKDLIDTFKAVRDNPRKLIIFLEYFKKNNSKEFYYKTRDLFNNFKIAGIKRSAAFIYLNKTCFNGLYRVNRKGDFNVPYGNQKNPEIFNVQTIIKASNLLKGSLLICTDYSEITKHVKKNDFVYLDPCYDPLKKTSFVKYTPNILSESENDRLAEFVATLKKKGAKLLFSNNVTEGVKKRYPQSEGFIWILVKSPRYINSVGSNRGSIEEFLIKSYIC